ncbi:uncharacterized protein TrAFT101_002457 [Trichoderma asperellum]|uniref:uncharacterized protein n=1 Tax=Trichoderma asperellum TaxID=101201 RepID=UPI00332B3FE4|nr:hypothetical protein TrAFT101_002457 [Trichoderma asperellum]
MPAIHRFKADGNRDVENTIEEIRGIQERIKRTTEARSSLLLLTASLPLIPLIPLMRKGTGRPAPSAGSVFYFLFELAKGAISTLAEVSPQELVICEELLASFESVGVFTKNSEMRFCPRVLSGDIPARKTRGEGSEMGGR